MGRGDNFDDVRGDFGRNWWGDDDGAMRLKDDGGEWERAVTRHVRAESFAMRYGLPLISMQLRPAGEVRAFDSIDELRADFERTAASYPRTPGPIAAPARHVLTARELAESHAYLRAKYGLPYDREVDDA